MQSSSIKSVCGYCGVGCGVSYESTILKGDKNYPINEGNLCAKGSSELLSIQSYNRLLSVQIRSTINEAYVESSWEESIDFIAQKIKQTNPKKVGFYLSGQMLTEDYYIANKLGKGFIGTNNVDTNSRTCMSSAVVGYKKSIGADFVPLRMNDIFKANLLILAGANTAEAHVVFHGQIKKAQKSGLKVVVIDPRHTETAKIADIHLPLKVGSDIDLFNLISKRLIEQELYNKEFVTESLNNFEELKEGLLSLNEEKILEQTGLNGALFETFWMLYKESDNIITAWTMGLNQSVQGVDKNLALINTHLLTGKIFKVGNGPLSLTGQPNAMGGREVGGLSTMLAVHLGFDSESIKKVSKFWKTDKIDNQAGLTATQMLEGDLEVLIICHTDPVYHLPNRHKVEAQMAKIPLVVEINAYENSESSKFAHIRLPATPWGEKEGVQTNLDRSMTKQSILKPPLGKAKADWKIFQDIAQALGYKNAFNFKNSKEVFEEYQAMTKLNSYMDIANANYEELGEKPFVWGEAIKYFLTPNKKGNLFFVQNQHLSEATSSEYPFLLLTGRTRDQWHSGTKSLIPSRLLKYKTLDFCEMHPDDAERLGLKEDERVWVSSKRGKIQVTVYLTTHVQEGTIFIPISHRGVNYLTHDLLDAESFEPDYNHSAVKIERIKRVYLVGCGLGDPELLTLKAYRIIQSVEVVLYDNLISDEIMALVPKKTIKVYVGKQKGHHSKSQQDIHETIMEYTSKGLSVARLKSGDPFIFGRGAEELMFLNGLGITTEVIPGISSSISAPLLANIPITARDYASSFSVVSPHSKGHGLNIDWVDLLHKKNHTVVVLMGLSRIPQIIEEAKRLRVSLDKPCAIISNASRVNQKTVRTTLANLEEASETMVRPSILVFGEVVNIFSV